MSDINIKDLLTTNDLLRMFQVTAMTLRKWRMAKGLPTHYVGQGRRKNVVFLKPEIVSWAQTHHKKVKAPRKK